MDAPDAAKQQVSGFADSVKGAKTLSFIAQFPVGIGLKLAEQGQDQNYDEDKTDNSRRTVAPRPAMAPRWKSTD